MIACDSVSDLSLDAIVESHMSRGSFVTMVLKEDKVDVEKNKVIQPSSLADNHDVFLLDEINDNAVIFVDNYQDVKESGLKVKKAVLSRHPKATIKTNLFDSHIYVCKRELLSLLTTLDTDGIVKNLVSMKDDVLPFLVKN